MVLPKLHPPKTRFKVPRRAQRKVQTQDQWKLRPKLKQGNRHQTQIPTAIRPPARPYLNSKWIPLRSHLPTSFCITTARQLNHISRYPPDSPTESWPKIRGWNLSVSTDPLPYAARHLPRTNVIALMVQVLGEVRHHVITQGDEIIPSNLDVSVVEIASRGLKFEICRLVAAGLTQWYADAEGEAEVELRWSDIVPIITVFRAKMQTDSQWRERAVWIKHSETNVRLGMAKIVSRFPGFEPGDPNIESGKCEY